MSLIEVSKKLSENVGCLSFAEPVTFCYNPLEYAWKSHAEYLKKYGEGKKEALFLGMNPGPFGMAQTGVPFGDVVMVRDWMKIEEKVGKPAKEHPKRPVDGFACPKREVSGSRLWGWAQERFPKAEDFFSRFFVWNFCPLSFMEESSRNRTPDKLPPEERKQLFAHCRSALENVIDVLQPDYLIGVGKFAEKQLNATEISGDKTVSWILHPSPASPAANRGWAKQAEAQLKEMGISI